MIDFPFKIKYVLLIAGNFLLAFLFCNNIAAQSAGKRAAIDRAKTAIRTLADGVLVVRLESNRKKIQKLKELLDKKDLDKRGRKNLQQQLDKTLSETDERNRLLIQSFADNYDFSEVLFMYDYDTEKLGTATEENYFLNQNLEFDSDITLANRPYLTLRFGTTNLATTSGIEGLIITDAQLQDLSNPFPYAYKEGGFMFVFDKIFDGENAATRYYPRLIERINKKLKRYYNEVE